MLTEESGDEIKDDYQLMSYIKSLAEAKREYGKIRDALKSAEETGYGIVTPTVNELSLSEPDTAALCLVGLTHLDGDILTRLKHIQDLQVFLRITRALHIDDKVCHLVVEVVEDDELIVAGRITDVGPHIVSSRIKDKDVNVPIGAGHAGAFLHQATGLTVVGDIATVTHVLHHLQQCVDDRTLIGLANKSDLH